MSSILNFPRLLSVATAFWVLTFGFASGAFGTFSTDIIPGYSCSAYGYFVGFWYGYDCNQTSGPGGGAWSFSSTQTVTPMNTSPSQSGSTGAILPTPGVHVLPLEKVIARDISKHRYKSAIETLVSRGVMENVSRIFPNKWITRAEFVKLLAKVNGFLPLKSSYQFEDVSEADEFTQYIAYGVEKGWINTKNAKFRPNEVITQGEVDKLIDAVLGKATADTVARASNFTTRAKAAQDIFRHFFQISE